LTSLVLIFNLLRAECLHRSKQPKENSMKSTSVIRRVTAITFVAAGLLSTAASANDFDCFPLCDTAKVATTPVTPQTPEIPETPAKPTCTAKSDAPSSAQTAVEKIENVNNQLKPIKEIAGYIQSPQGLAVKLVNDHIVKIPAWVGYAIDPVGAIKNKAMGEVRDRAKTALKEEFSKPAAATCVAPAEANEAT
jgi:hypothetical protein